LKALHKLAYVDLHYNPLDPEAGAVILALKANNPGVQILAGQEPRVTKEDRREQLSARAEIAEFARCVRWRYEDGVAMPMIPGVTNGEELPDKTAKALLCLMKSQDKEYLADLAAIFVKYAIEIEEHYTPGPVWDPERPLLRAFLQGVDLKVGDEAGIPALVLGHWVLGHRDKLAPSVFLDVQIAKYGKLLKDYSDARNGVR
jgi:hypothetical protein